MGLASSTQARELREVGVGRRGRIERGFERDDDLAVGDVYVGAIDLAVHATLCVQRRERAEQDITLGEA